MDVTTIIQIFVVIGGLVLLAGFTARQAYRADSRRLARELNLRIGFFGGLSGEVDGMDFTIEPGTPLKINIYYRPPHVSAHIIDINLWFLRKGLPVPWDTTHSEDNSNNAEPQPSEKLDDLANIFDYEFEVWSRPAEFGDLAFWQQQKLGSRVAKSNLQVIEVNWLFPGLSCLTDLSMRDIDAAVVQRNIDIAIELAQRIEREAGDYLLAQPETMPMY